ncbi:MAG: hypothetical protein ACI959_001601 [Limisphaerales bacterium]|jgi:hypothetical protein
MKLTNAVLHKDNNGRKIQQKRLGIMNRIWMLLGLAVLLMSADACTRKSAEATGTTTGSSSTQTTQSTQTGSDGNAGAMTSGGQEYGAGDYLALAPLVGANVQGAFMRMREVNSSPFYKNASKVNELGITLTRGLSGTGATYSRYGDPKRDPLYKGMGWGKSAQEYPTHKRAVKIQKRDTKERNSFYDDWIDFTNATNMKDMILVANMYMPFSELEAFIEKARANGVNILWLEADNETNSTEHQEGLFELLKEVDPKATTYNRAMATEKAFGLYWDWVGELEDFGTEMGIPVSVVGTPSAYAFPEMLDPKTMGDKANISPNKVKSDRLFNQIGSDRTKANKLETKAVSRHRYRQYDLVRGEVNARNDVLRKKLEYPIYRSYYRDLKKTEVDHYRKLYPNSQIIFTEWGLRKPEGGAGNSFAVAVDVAKFLVANCQINVDYGFNVVDAVTFQSMYGHKMGGLIYHDNNSAVKIAPEGIAMSMFSQLSGRPILEIGNGDDSKTQWIRIACAEGEKIFFYNLGNSDMNISYSGDVEFLQSEDLLSENTTIDRQNGVSKLPKHSIGVLTIK